MINEKLGMEEDDEKVIAWKSAKKVEENYSWYQIVRYNDEDRKSKNDSQSYVKNFSR